MAATDSSVAAATVTAPVTSARRGVPVTAAGHASATATAPWRLNSISLSPASQRAGFGDPRLAPNRLGQQAFKAVVGDAYHSAVRDHRRQDPPRPRGRPHPAAVTPVWRGKPARQRIAAEVGNALTLAT